MWGLNLGFGCHSATEGARTPCRHTDSMAGIKYIQDEHRASHTARNYSNSKYKKVK